jgi:ParB family chromosome partitioning protein
MATKKTTESPEFLYLPMGSIIVEEQIRSKIDMTSESFKALMESINNRGVLEPVLVTQKDDKYLLLCGERRYLAAQKLRMETIPARIVNAVTQKDEILAIQMTENLQREDLNPIDQAKGILAFFQAKHPEKNYNPDGVFSELVVYERRQEDLPQEIRVTVTQISEIVGKSIKTIFNAISLLKLIPKIQDAISIGKLPFSQGYLFAANLGSPDFFTIFDEITEKPVTNVKLEKMLTAYKKAKPKTTKHKPIPMKKKIASLQTTKTYFQKKTGMYTKPDLQAFLDELKSLAFLIEEQLKKAPETVQIEKPGDKPRPQV